ncbi:MAG: nicotinate-nucleotide adenylyltransferase [Alphaproteobacteria bacterium]
MHLPHILRPSSVMRIGLLGGSFDPPHLGHLALAQQAMKHLDLDRVWWLVAPNNPLKHFAGGYAPPPQAVRCDAVRQMLRPHPRMDALGLPQDGKTYFTLQALKAACPKVQFVWLMGWDAFCQIHRWDRWQQIMTQHRLALFDRMGYNGVMNPVAAFAFSQYQTPPQRIFNTSAGWCRLRLRLPQISSTDLRAALNPV